jgi:hypothetical protein
VRSQPVTAPYLVLDLQARDLFSLRMRASSLARSYFPHKHLANLPPTSANMLARRLVPSSSASSSSLLRSFASSTTLREPPRSPSLSDIKPDGGTSFNARQKDFRENLEAAKKAKEQADSQSLATPEFPSSAHKNAPTAHSGGNASSHFVLDAAVQLDPAALGSLSTHRIVGEARQAEHDAASSKKKGGAFSNLIYGTVEGQQMDKEMERSFSQVLARGKYVHSIVFHEVKPDKVDEYVELVGNWYPRMASMPENKVNLVGSWRSEVGDCETFGWKIPSLVDISLTSHSTHLGISKIHRLPYVLEQHLASSRLSCF